MKTLFAYILIGAVIGIAIFGAALMNHGILPMNGRCVAETVNGAICPQNPITEAFFHVDALRFFSTAVFNPALFAALILLLAIIGYVALSRQFHARIDSLLAGMQNFAVHLPTPATIRFRHWLAFHELSPPDLATARNRLA